MPKSLHGEVREFMAGSGWLDGRWLLASVLDADDWQYARYTHEGVRREGYLWVEYR